MDHDRASELLGALVLDSCDRSDTDQLHVHLQSCAACCDELDRLNAVAGLIGASDLEAPPPELRDAILDAARDIP